MVLRMPEITFIFIGIFFLIFGYVIPEEMKANKFLKMEWSGRTTHFSPRYQFMYVIPNVADLGKRGRHVAHRKIILSCLVIRAWNN